MFRNLAWRIEEWFGGHPSDGRLFSLRDGALSDRQRACVTEHLKKCDRCRAKTAQMEREWKRFAELSAVSNIKSSIEENELLAKIRSDIRAWSNANPSPLSSLPANDFEKTETGHKVAAVLSIYLGNRAAAALLQTNETPERERAGKLIGAERTLSILLGRKCAAAIDLKLRRIMEELPKSTCESS
jgi:anti-sigma factor RsiW